MKTVRVPGIGGIREATVAGKYFFRRRVLSEIGQREQLTGGLVLGDALKQV